LFDPAYLALKLLVVLPALTFHEFAHAYSAYRFGDPTPRLAGRVTLNPLAHFDLVGTLMIMFGPFGWAKPVPINPYNMREPAKHTMICTACGPLANVSLALLASLVLRVLVAAVPRTPPLALYFLFLFVLVNFSLAIFNLIPLGVLDGHEVLRYFLPFDMKVRYHEWNRRYGMFALMGLIFWSIICDRYPALAPFDILGYLLRPTLWLTSLCVGR
jgi:Zn-dependent protease